MQLTCDDVSYRYSRRKPFALTEVNLTIEVGERVILLGPNGAGKSTLIRTLAGVTPTSTGSVSVRTPQHQITGRDLRRHVAWMPQTVTPIPRLTLREHVTYAAWLSGMTQRQARAAADPALTRVDLATKAGERTTTLSGGQLRRLGLAETLARGSQFLLLDEPTAGLDPAQRQRFREILNTLTDKAILVSTHETHDIADLFTRVIVLHHGRIRFDGTITEFTTTQPNTTPTTVENAFTALIGTTDS